MFMLHLIIEKYSFSLITSSPNGWFNRTGLDSRARLACKPSPHFCILHRAFHNHCPSNNSHNMFLLQYGNDCSSPFSCMYSCNMNIKKYRCILPPSRRERERMNAKFAFQVRFLLCIGLWIHTFAQEWKTSPVNREWGIWSVITKQ